MNFSETFEKAFKRFLPTPFSIALILTLLAFILAYIFTKPPSMDSAYIVSLAEFWQNGLWNAPLLVFAMQMMLMLVLGHTLALAKPINNALDRVIPRLDSTPKAAFWVCLLTLCVAFINWGLGLVFGALFARKVAESSVSNGMKINYPIIGAAGYSGLMVWHGGLSGSAPVKVNEPGHIQSLVTHNAQLLTELPEAIPASETLFGGLNMTTSLLLLTLIPLTFYVLGKRSSSTPVSLNIQMNKVETKMEAKGAEKIDQSNWVGRTLGVLLLLFAIYLALGNSKGGLSFLTPNFINFTLFGLALSFHGSINNFLKAVDSAIGGAAGILIQFPLYFGIMGLMKDSGLIAMIAEFLATHSTAVSFPIITFFSSGLINIFVPSGGGQWAIQGPVIIETATNLNVPLSKAVMAMAYGDRLTNMLQPFWALPLLGITGLKAKAILPYTVIIMLVGAAIFLTTLLLF